MSQYIEKKNGKIAFDKSKGSYYVYWVDPDTGKRKTTTYARWYWEVHRGEIPDGYRASYKDGNSLNIEPNNIILISPKEFGKQISKRLMGHGFSEETLQKMSDAKKGGKLSEEHKKKIGKATKRMWREGVFDDPKIREAYSKQGKSTKGSKRTKEQREKLSEIQKERFSDPREREKLSNAQKERWDKPNEREIHSQRMKRAFRENPQMRKKISLAMRNREFSEEHLEKLSVAGRNREDIRGENSIWWRGGTDNVPYPDEFSPYLKRKIKKRDNYTCQSCNRNIYGKSGHVHHIDGNKQNCEEENLILLCITCHNAVHGKNTITNDKIEGLRSLLLS